MCTVELKNSFFSLRFEYPDKMYLYYFIVFFINEQILLSIPTGKKNNRYLLIDNNDCFQFH